MLVLFLVFFFLFVFPIIRAVFLIAVYKIEELHEKKVPGQEEQDLDFADVAVGVVDHTEIGRNACAAQVSRRILCLVARRGLSYLFSR